MDDDAFWALVNLAVLVVVVIAQALACYLATRPFRQSKD